MLLMRFAGMMRALLNALVMSTLDIATLGGAWRGAGRGNWLPPVPPMLIVSGAAYTGYLSLDESFAWLATPATLIMLGAAALVEIVASRHVLSVNRQRQRGSRETLVCLSSRRFGGSSTR